MKQKEFVTIKEMAEMLGITRATVWNWVNDGYIKASRSGPTPNARIRIPRAEAERLVREYGPQSADKRTPA